jgi:Lon protease-like protein
VRPGLLRFTVSAVAQLLPIFPLDTVLMPGAPLPLHIFEPRYRALIADVWDPSDPNPAGRELAGFGIVSRRDPQGGGEVRRPGRPDRPGRHHRSDPDGELASVGTFASIVEVEHDDQGRSNLLTIGRGRFRLLELEPVGKPYLQAHIDWLPEEHGAVSDSLAEAAQARCSQYLRKLAEVAGRPLPEVTYADDPLILSYQLAARMRLANSERQGLLEAGTAAERLRMALRLLRREIVLMTRTKSVPVSPAVLYLETRPN